MESFVKDILESTGANSFHERELVQELWSGYGAIKRLELKGSNYPTIIAKHIRFPLDIDHPRGWNSETSHLRKVKSYEVEKHWYQNFAKECKPNCKVATPILVQGNSIEHIILLEDLDNSGFAIRKNHLDFKEVKWVLDWLAHFHATFLGRKPEGLWKIGSYWHLETRPDEYTAMENSPLKQKAEKIDQILNSAKFQTIIHGDAKVANFCFSVQGPKVAAVDFQYVGGGCGMKDIAYLLGSCLSSEELGLWEEELLKHYFIQLECLLEKHYPHLEFKELEEEWRFLYPFAWADFQRFLLGWMPSHKKLHSHSQSKVDEALSLM